MPHFFSKNHKPFSIKFEEIDDNPEIETPFWETQRAEALKILTTFYTSWQALWFATIRSLGNLNLDEETFRQLEFYEAEQKKTVISILARILVAWEKDDDKSFGGNVLSLARELRPSLVHFESALEKPITLNQYQILLLQNYTKNESVSLRNAVEELQGLAWHKFEFGDKVLTEHSAETLIREKLGLSFLDFIDSNVAPDFNAHGLLPNLLQETIDLSL